MIRDGIFMISEGYGEANNKFWKLYNPNKPTSYVIYLGTNNLYGYYMMQILSLEILVWVNPEKNLIQTIIVMMVQ